MSENAQQISVVKKDAYILVTFPPYESLEKGQLQMSAMYDAVDRHSSPRLLVDSRATRKQIPILDLYELAVYLAGKFGPLRPKMAVLLSPEATYPDRFGENVARNRGLELIRFVGNEQEAVDWLLADKPASQP